MIVSAASRMSRAISFGVFWRLAPSTMRDHAVEERLARVGADADDEPVGEHRVPPVTALRSPPLSRMTGALSPVIGALVHGGDALDDLAVAPG